MIRFIYFCIGNSFSLFLLQLALGHFPYPQVSVYRHTFKDLSRHVISRNLSPCGSNYLPFVCDHVATLSPIYPLTILVTQWIPQSF